VTDVQHAPPAGDVLLAPDTTLAHYRIVCRIGSGGMGDVYKAFDTHLERHVALKVLRRELLHDPEKVRRFTQEAKAASALNHPAIVTIYEVATARGIQYIAMEYVEGPSLREYFHENIPLPKLLDVIGQVAEGMSKAHSAGVIHRDLKPDNIVLTANRQPKIVDFGLAKLLQSELLSPSTGVDGGPTLALPHSSAGAVMGTVGYMSPEQVEGKPVDHRSDVFSLGCILYEAVTRRHAFDGPSMIEILHRILNTEPEPAGELNPGAPSQIDRVIRRCLAKDPDNRYQSIKEVAIEIRDLLADETPRTELKTRSRKRWMSIAIAGVVAAALLATAVTVRWMDREASDAPNYRFTPFSTDAAYEGYPAWSPDGKSIAYIAEVDGILQVFVKGIDATQATQITHAVRDCREPFWDPRGNRIFYIALAGDRDSLWSVGVGGGEPEVFLTNVSTAAISPDRSTLAMLREVSDPGNFSLVLWTSSPPESTPRPSVFPSARHFANGFIRFSPDNSKIALWTSARFDPVANEAREFWIIPRDGATAHKVLPTLIPAPRHYPFAWFPDSRHLVFTADHIGSNPGMHLWTADIVTGKVEPLTRTAGIEYYPSVSPDGKRIVYSTEEDDFDLVRIPIDGSAVTPFLATSRIEKDPVWSPTGNEYTYITNRSGALEIWMASGDGQWRRPVTTASSFDGPTFLLANVSFSPDGQRIAYQRRGNRNYHIWISPVKGGPAVGMTENPQQFEDAPTWSPDGNWIAYTTSTPGTSFALAKTRLGGGSPPVIIKQDIVFPSNPQWSPRGDWITVDLPEGFSLVTPDGTRTRLLSERTWIVHTWTRDGGTIYGIRTDDTLHLVLAKIDVATAKETIIADLGPAAPTINPVEGLSLAADGKSFLSSIPHLKGDLWIVEGYPEPKRSLLSRIRSAF
jgi:eukaryotic-like serine/threonine-protein kinase